MAHDTASCEKIFAILSEYLDLELPPEACAEVEAHLADCSPCVEFADSLRKTVEICRQYEPTTLPGPLSDDAKRSLEDAWRNLLARKGSA